MITLPIDSHDKPFTDRLGNVWAIMKDGDKTVLLELYNAKAKQWVIDPSKRRKLELAVAELPEASDSRPWYVKVSDGDFEDYDFYTKYLSRAWNDETFKD